MSTLVNVKDLSVSYFTYAGEVQSVRGVSFEIEKGKTTAIVGESGCGKSVTSKSLMGLIEKPGVIKEGSQILYEGKSILDFSEREWYAFRGKECSMIFQDALVSLNPTMMVGKQIMENLQNHNDENLSQAQIQKRAQEMLELVGIPDAQACMNKYPHELSGGQRQRVMIATALITNPKLLIADEPTTSLDVTIQAQILELMKQLQQKLGMAIIMITHDLGVVADMADDIIVMYAGKIVEKGSSDDIFYHPHHPYTWALMNSVPRLDLDNKKELVTIEGSIPDMIHPPKGCAFCSRCPYAMNICAEYEPETVDAQDGSDKHQVACWLSDPRADRTGVQFQIGGAVHASQRNGSARGHQPLQILQGRQKEGSQGSGRHLLCHLQGRDARHRRRVRLRQNHQRQDLHRHAAAHLRPGQISGQGRPPHDQKRALRLHRQGADDLPGPLRLA